MTRPTIPARARSTAWRHVAAGVILLGVTVLFFSGLLVGKTYSEVSRFQQVAYPWGDPNVLSQRQRPRIIHYDQAKSYYPWQVFMNRSLRDGEVPLWNPYSFSGTPFLAANANNVLYPPRIALSLVVSPARVHDLLAAAHMFLAGLTMFVLLAYFRASFAGSVLGAVTWMASSFMVAWLALDHFGVVAAFLPLALLLIDVAIRRRSWPAALALGVVLAVLLLGGNILFVELCFVALGAYGAALMSGRVIVALRGHGPRRSSREVAGEAVRFAAPWFLGVGLSAITLLPTLELVGSTARTPLSLSELRDLGLPLSELKNLFIAPNLDEPSFLRDPYHAALFGGTAVGVLALVGFAARRPGAWFARILGLVSVLVALGTPVLALPYWILPGFDNLKPPGRVLFLLAFALAILAAFGLDAVLAWVRDHTRTRAAAVLAIAIPVAAVGVTLVQLRLYASDIMHTQEPTPRLLYPVTPLVERIHSDPDARFLPVGGVLPGSTALVYPLRNSLGYESIVPGRVQDFWRVVAGLDPSELSTTPVQSAFEPVPTVDRMRLDLLPRAGIDYVVLPPATTEAAVDPTALSLVYDASDGQMFRVANALPRAYIVGRCEQATDSRAALGRFQERDFNPSDAVILEQTALHRARLQCDSSRPVSGGSAEVVRERTNGLTLEVDAKARGFLVVNETWDSGWRAAIDGRDVRVLAANSVFRAIPIDVGRHIVELRYEPDAYETGLWISRGALIFTLAGFATIAARRLLRFSSTRPRV